MPAARVNLTLPRVNVGEETLLFQVKALNLPVATRNYVFHPDRKWQIDVAWPSLKVGIEVQGGVWRKGGGAHSRPTNILRDMAKHNALLDAGWRVYCFTPQQVKSGEAIAHVEKHLWVTNAVRA